MGGLMKGHHHHHHGHGNGNKGKPYGLMILMALCVAIIGVMVVHKFRERRIFSLIVQEKDRELNTFQLLLQKEREHVREAKWKLEEMKTKLNTLRAQKRGLDSKIVEMQSTISSLREEQRTIEASLDEKQNEIKMMRERDLEISNDNPQVIALSEMLRQKESEVEDLKNRLETPVKVWSVSTDDPSSANINLQTTPTLTERDDRKDVEEKDTSVGLQESANHEAAKYSTELADSGSEPADIRTEQPATQGEDTRKNGGENADSRGNIREETDKEDDPKDIVSEHGNSKLEERNDEEGRKKSDISQTGEASGVEEENNAAQIQAVVHRDNEGQRLGDEINEGRQSSTEYKVLQTREDGLQGRTSNSQGAENQESGMKGGMKLEMSDRPQIGRNRQDGKGYLKKTKRKKWNKIHRTRKNIGNFERNGAAATRDKSFTEGTMETERDKDGNQGTMHRDGSSVGNDSGSEDQDNKIINKLLKDELSEKKMSEQVEAEHGEENDSDLEKVNNRMQESKDSPEGTGLLKHDEDAKELSKDTNNSTELKVEKSLSTNETSKSTELDHISLRNIPTTENEIFSEVKQQNQLEPKTSENQATSLKEQEERVNAHKEEEISQQAEIVNSNEEPDNPKIKGAKETESKTDASIESTLNSEADGKSYNES